MDCCLELQQLRGARVMDFGALTKISDDAVNFAISKLENITEDERKKARSNREKRYLR